MKKWLISIIDDTTEEEIMVVRSKFPNIDEDKPVIALGARFFLVIKFVGFPELEKAEFYVKEHKF